MTSKYAVSHLTNIQLVEGLASLVRRQGDLTAMLLAHIGEIDGRRLYAEDAFSSMHGYCVSRLHLSEGAAFKRIAAARLARRFPLILDKVAAGEVHLSALMLLRTHLTADNHAELLEAVTHQSKRAVERLVAQRFPKPDVPATVRKLPAPAANATNSSPPLPMLVPTGSAPDSTRPTPPATVAPRRASPATLQPLAPQRYKIQLTAGQELYDKLQQARELLRHQVPNGDIAEILDRALTLLVADTKKKRFALGARSSAPRAKGKKTARSRGRRASRHIRNDVKREVFERDGGQCTFTNAQGERCSERGWLELHHAHPYEKGGDGTSANIFLRCKLCRARHNLHYADRVIMPRRAA